MRTPPDGSFQDNIQDSLLTVLWQIFAKPPALLSNPGDGGRTTGVPECPGGDADSASGEIRPGFLAGMKALGGRELLMAAAGGVLT